MQKNSAQLLRAPSRKKYRYQVSLRHLVSRLILIETLIHFLKFERAKKHRCLLLLVAMLVVIEWSTVFWTSNALASSEAAPAVQSGTNKVYLPLISKVIPPRATTSRYIHSNVTPVLDPAKYYNMGYYSYTEQTGIVVFHFGQPCSDYSGGVLYYGASLYGSTCRSVAQINTAIQEFIRGYCDRNGCSSYAASPRISFALGVSNCSNGGPLCANPTQSTNVTTAHGQAWGQLVNDVYNYVISRNYTYQVAVAGAMDIEPQWNTPANTRNWLGAL